MKTSASSNEQYLFILNSKRSVFVYILLTAVMILSGFSGRSGVLSLGIRICISLTVLEVAARYSLLNWLVSNGQAAHFGCLGIYMY